MRYFLTPLLLLMLSTSTGAAQQQESRESVRKLVVLENIAVREVSSLVGGFVRTSLSPQLNAVVIEGPPAAVEQALAVIAEIDRPSRKKPLATDAPDPDLEIEAYFLGAGKLDRPVPKLLQPVVEELAARFSGFRFAMLDVAMVRTALGRSVEVEGLVPEVGEAPIRYMFGATAARLQESAGVRSVTFDPLRLKWNLPVPAFKDPNSLVSFDIGLDTRMTVPLDKFVVVGRTGARGDIEAIFLVLRVRQAE